MLKVSSARKRADDKVCIVHTYLVYTDVSNHATKYKEKKGNTEDENAQMLKCVSCTHIQYIQMGRIMQPNIRRNGEIQEKAATRSQVIHPLYYMRIENQHLKPLVEIHQL